MSVEGSTQGGAGGSAAAAGGQAGEGAQGSGGASGGASGAGAEGTDSTCLSPGPAAAPLRRLKDFEYYNTVRSLFGDASAPADDRLVDSSSLNAAEDAVTAAQVEAYHERAHELALSIGGDPAALDALLGCTLADEAEDICQGRLFNELLPRIFRRPLDNEDVADFEAVLARGQELGGGFASGVRAVLEVALQSPEFLYLLEFGGPAPELGDAWARLTPYELATRLSYLYWSSAPDAELLAAAAEGLATKEEVQAQATRLLSHERARDGVRHFYAQLFGLGIPALASSGEYPGFTEEVAELMLQETAHYVDSVTWEAPGDFRTLLTATHSYVNGTLAAFYGIDAVAGEGFERVEFDPTRRAGILTQPSLLAKFSYSLGTSPTRRGHLVRKKLLCFQVADEPPDLVLTVPVPDGPAPPTTRERFAQHTADAACAACHSLMDPIGFGFGNYDAAGLWQDAENGVVIDASGEIYQTDAAGTFLGAAELAERLAESEDARRCYVQNWMDFAYRRGDAVEDVCTRPFLNEAFLSSDGNVQQLLQALSQTEAFLYRPSSEATP
jgi:hypothetical protein